jgi:cell division protein FtsB
MRVFSLRGFWLPVMLTTLVAALFGALLAHRGRDLARLEAELIRLDRDLAMLKQENLKLKRQRDALLSSPEAIERIGREDYGLASPGEHVVSVAPERVAPQRPRGGTALWGRVPWRDVPLQLTASVFILAAIVFALINAFTGRPRAYSEPPEEPVEQIDDESGAVDVGDAELEEGV